MRSPKLLILFWRSPLLILSLGGSDRQFTFPIPLQPKFIVLTKRRSAISNWLKKSQRLDVYFVLRQKKLTMIKHSLNNYSTQLGCVVRALCLHTTHQHSQ